MNKIKKVAMLGIVIFVTLIACSSYSLNYNEGRIVLPMDYSNYTFQIKDISMWLAIALMIAYVFYVVALIISATLKRQREDGNYTRRIDARFGYFGFAGFLGFIGFYTYYQFNYYAPFAFFMFFGFFGFFYEAKLAHLYKDERYLQNADKARAQATTFGFSLIFLLLIFICMGDANHINIAFPLMLISISIICGLTIFLNEYLLYKYDSEENFNE